MELHTPHGFTHKKKWAEYLLEFLMLFLAVYLGFLAENIREHRVEKEMAQQYIESFYEDLKLDTSRIAANINFDGAKLEALARMNDCYQSLLQNESQASCLLGIIKSAYISKPFKKTDRTLNQLFNAGGFRLLPKEDADSINVLEEEFENFNDFQATIYQDAQKKIRNTFNLLVNYSANRQMFQPVNGKVTTAFNDSAVTAPVLFAGNKALLNQYFNELQLYYRATYSHRSLLQALREKQVTLIDYFKKKYDFR